MDDQGRIQLAKAMGWSRKILPGGIGEEGERLPAMSGWLKPDGTFAPKFIDGREPIPDPFTDASDDYAVLEWMREQAPRKDGHGILYCPYLNELDGVPQYEYEVGDNARAALRVIERLSQGEGEHG